MHLVDPVHAPGDPLPLPDGVPSFVLPVAQCDPALNHVFSIAAISLVRSAAVATLAAPAVQAAIDSRLSPFPQLMHTNVHRTNVRVPAAAAALLLQDASLLAAAVDAFDQRDPDDMRACKQMAVFPPTTAVYIQVKMTRCQYAALARADRFIVPRTFGTAPPQKSARYLPFLVGTKLVCIAACSIVSSCTAFRLLAAGLWDGDSACACAWTGGGPNGRRGIFRSCMARFVGGQCAKREHACPQKCSGPEWEACVHMLRSIGFFKVCLARPARGA